AVVEGDTRTDLDRERLVVRRPFVLARELGNDVELLVQVEELVAQAREDDATHEGAGERRIEDVGILGESDAERFLGVGGKAEGGGKEQGGEAADHGSPRQMSFPRGRDDTLSINLLLRGTRVAGALRARSAPLFRARRAA